MKSNVNHKYNNLNFLQLQNENSLDENHVTKNQTHLTIEYPTRKDEGTYECRAKGHNNATASKWYHVQLAGGEQ